MLKSSADNIQDAVSNTEKSTAPELVRLTQITQRISDTQEIQKLTSLRAYYHAAGRNDLSFELYSRDLADISWGQNESFWIGYKSIQNYYVRFWLQLEAAERTRMSGLYPGIGGGRDDFGAGAFFMHPITTPLIEVAGDGRTAKGVFYAPGAVAFVNETGNLSGYTMWESYGMDFVKEGGRWKFWHIHIYTDFAVRMGNNFVGGKDKNDQTDSGVLLPPDAPRPDLIKGSYKGWVSDGVRELRPRPPEPYYTFAETFSYGPEKWEEDC